MTSTIDAECAASETVDKPELTEAEKTAQLEAAIERREKLAESHLEMAQMFIKNGKLEIAKRRLVVILEEFSESSAVPKAQALLKQL